MSGHTFAAKDIFDVAGHICCAGSPDWLATHEPAETTATSVQKLLGAGATLVGKTHTTELTYSGTGRNELFTTPINPRALDRLPGGSSSGSAVAVAGELVDFALGSDTGGSIRVPAALCGVAGMRVSHGGIASDGVVPLAPSLDTVGALASDLKLLAAVHRELLDHPPARPSWTRAILATDAWAATDPEVAATIAPAAERIARVLPVERSPICEQHDGLARWADVTRVCQAFEVWQTHGAWVTATKPTHSALVERRMAAASAVSRDEAREAEELRRRASQRVRGLVRDDTVIVLPTSPTVAPHADESDAALLAWWARVSELTSPANLSGLPQLSIPAGDVDGLPVGLSLLGPERSELALIELASEITGDDGQLRNYMVESRAGRR